MSSNLHPELFGNDRGGMGARQGSFLLSPRNDRIRDDLCLLMSTVWQRSALYVNVLPSSEELQHSPLLCTLEDARLHETLYGNHEAIRKPWIRP
jgi:hypothetical protein